ncbi:MAG: DNA-binding protein [Candidatus Thorarchaeota archaeon]
MLLRGFQVEVVILTDDDPDLALIRRKKMARLMKREKEMEATREQREKVTAEREKLLRRFLAPDALDYFEGLKKREPTIGKQVEEVILYLIVYRGFRQTISQVDVMYIERQVKGEGPRIKIQRDGETSDFGSYVREAIRKGSDE